MNTDLMIREFYPKLDNVKKVSPEDHDIERYRREIERILRIKYMNKKTNKREFVTARNLFVVGLKIFTNHSLEYIGSEIERDHATVIHAIKTTSQLYDTDSRFRLLFDKVIHMADNIFTNNWYDTPVIKRSFGMVPKNTFKYAIDMLLKEISHKDHVGDLMDLKKELQRKNEILKDKDREIRFLKSQLERSRMKNSYEYVD